MFNLPLCDQICIYFLKCQSIVINKKTRYQFIRGSLSCLLNDDSVKVLLITTRLWIRDWLFIYRNVQTFELLWALLSGKLNYTVTCIFFMNWTFLFLSKGNQIKLLLLNNLILIECFKQLCSPNCFRRLLIHLFYAKLLLNNA